MELVTSEDFNVSEGVGFSVGDTVDTIAINPDIEESLANNNNSRKNSTPNKYFYVEIYFFLILFVFLKI